jgi:AcrR family transcriptional regulator
MSIAEKGVEALSVNELTRRLGVSGSAPYQHFATRRALLAATAAQTGRQLAKDMRAAVTKAVTRSDTGCEATEALAATAAAYVRFVARHRAGVDFVFADDLTALHHRELAESGRAVMDVLLPLTLAVAGDPSRALRLLEQHIAAAHGFGSLYTAGFTRDRQESVDAVAAAAAQVTRTLAAAAAQRSDTTPTITAAAVAS